MYFTCLTFSWIFVDFMILMPSLIFLNGDLLGFFCLVFSFAFFAFLVVFLGLTLFDFDFFVSFLVDFFDGFSVVFFFFQNFNIFDWLRFDLMDTGNELLKKDTLLLQEIQKQLLILNTAVAYLIWFIFGSIFGLHWIYVYRRNLKRPIPYLNVIFYILCWIIFWIARQVLIPRYTECVGSQMPSWDCFVQQTPLYQALYIIHLICLLLVIIHWIVDAFLLWYLERGNKIKLS
jgi:hypothetical protein